MNKIKLSELMVLLPTLLLVVWAAPDAKAQFAEAPMCVSVVRDSTAGTLSVTYSKTDAACAFLRTIFTGVPLNTHFNNLFCTVGTNVVKTNSLSQFGTANGAAGDLIDPLILCNGNDQRACTACGPIQDTVVAVAIDIKFCSDPNAFNCRKKGVLPVTIFGTASFDPLDIDPSTLRLCRDDTGACTAGAPIDFSIADRGDPTSDLGASMCAIDPATGLELHSLNPDGFLDFDAAFDATEVQTLLGDFCGGMKNEVSSTLVITGSTFGGIPISSAPVNNTGIDQLVKKDK